MTNLPRDRMKAAIVNLEKFMREPKLASLDFRALATTAGFCLIDGKRGDRIVLR